MRPRPTRVLPEDSEPDDAYHDQIDRHDVVEQARHQQNQDSGEDRYDRREVAEADVHRWTPCGLRNPQTGRGRAGPPRSWPNSMTRDTGVENVRPHPEERAQRASRRM